MPYIIIIYPLILGSLFLLSPKRKVSRIILNSVKMLGSIVLVLFFLRLFWFDIYKIPSASMEQTLQVGDKIIICKNTLPERNDVVVFESMNKDSLVLVKRCVGMPGDTLMIQKNIVYCNNEIFPEVGTLQWSYSYHKKEFDVLSIEGILNRPIELSNNNLLLTLVEAEILNEALPTADIKRVCRASNKRENIYPRYKQLTNNRDNISAFVVPRRGLCILLDTINVLWYRKLIVLENRGVRIDKSYTVYINNKKKTSYTFKNNYYYMMGDNRHRSCDSRFFGFVSESNILGNVVLTIPGCNK